MTRTLARPRRRIPRRTDIWPRPWRRRPGGALVVLLVALIAAWSRLQAPAGSDVDRYHEKTFTCLRGVDGDTIDIAAPDGSTAHTRIRLWGVDTPETANSPAGAMHFGPEASAFTHSLVDGKPVRIVLAPDRTRDKYGRLLAYVYVNAPPAAASQPGAAGGDMLNELLIAGGYAYADTRFKHPWRQRFTELEDRARRRQLGLWKSIRPEAMPKWRQRYEQWKEGDPEVVED